MESCGRVLIVDDEYIMRQGIKYMIDWEKEGYLVVGEASNGKEGLEKIGELSPHIVLCDIVMPIIGGVDFVKLVQRTYPNVQVIVLSGYDKFEYVKETLTHGAVDYLLKPTLNPEGLKKTLKAAVERVPGLKLKQKDEGGDLIYLEKYLIGETDIDGGRERQILPYTAVRMLALDLKRKGQKAEVSHIITEKLTEGIGKIKDCIQYPFMLREELFCVVLNFERKNKDVIEWEIKQLVADLLVYDESLFVVLGKTVGQLEEVKHNYREFICKMAEQAFYEKENNLLVQPEKVSDIMEVVVPKFDFSRFTAMLNSRQYAEVFQLLKEHIYYLVSARTAEDKLKNTAKNLIYNFFSVLDQNDNKQIPGAGNSQEAVLWQELDEMRYHFFKEMEQARYQEDFILVFEDCLKELMEYAGGQEESDIRIGQILEYIAANFRVDLDLTQLAQVFHFNYSYLSAYFNSRMPEGFSGYLNRIRIEKACTLLESGKLSIARVSEESGYSDQSYFCRVFKKIVGATPSEYRREQMKKSL